MGSSHLPVDHEAKCRCCDFLDVEMVMDLGLSKTRPGGAGRASRDPQDRKLDAQWPGMAPTLYLLSSQTLMPPQTSLARGNGKHHGLQSLLYWPSEASR